MRIPIPLPHTVRITPYLGDTAYGPQYGEPVDYRARVEFSTGLTKDPEGRDTVYNARIYLYPDAMVAPEAQINYTDLMGREYQLTAITVAPQSGINGQPSHIEVEARLG